MFVSEGQKTMSVHRPDRCLSKRPPAHPSSNLKSPITYHHTCITHSHKEHQHYLTLHHHLVVVVVVGTSSSCSNHRVLIVSESLTYEKYFYKLRDSRDESDLPPIRRRLPASHPSGVWSPSRDGYQPCLSIPKHFSKIKHWG
jgi:hypothetical protein